jgi:hypothetical protein
MLDGVQMTHRVTILLSLVLDLALIALVVSTFVTRGRLASWKQWPTWFKIAWIVVIVGMVACFTYELMVV